MKKLYVYECNSAPCRGLKYATTEQPLSCPYCDSTALEEEAIYIINNPKVESI